MVKWMCIKSKHVLGLACGPQRVWQVMQWVWQFMLWLLTFLIISGVECECVLVEACAMLCFFNKRLPIYDPGHVIRKVCAAFKNRYI